MHILVEEAFCPLNCIVHFYWTNVNNVQNGHLLLRVALCPMDLPVHLDWTGGINEQIAQGPINPSRQVLQSLGTTD